MTTEHNQPPGGATDLGQILEEATNYCPNCHEPLLTYYTNEAGETLCASCLHNLDENNQSAFWRTMQ